MWLLRTGSKACLLSSALLITTPMWAGAAEILQPTQNNVAATAHDPAFHAAGIGNRRVHWTSNRYQIRHATAKRTVSLKGHANRRVMVNASLISCVPYARQVSGIMVVGNAWQWWNNAAGQYARGDRPEAGSVLNFRANGRMRLGHVAVVTRVVNAREIIVDQANWPSTGMRGNVSHDVAVVDVSEANNWSAVRVELSGSGKFGSVYPAYGFIYNRPDTGVVMASVVRPAPLPKINPVTSDLRPAAERPWQTFEEVGESPTGTPRRIDLRVTPVAARFSN